MIRSFKDRLTRAVFEGESPKGFPADIARVARRKLRYMNAASDLNDLSSPPANRLEALKHIVPVSIRFAPTTSGASVSSGPPRGPKMLRLSTITRFFSRRLRMSKTGRR